MSGKVEAIALHLISQWETDVEYYCKLETVDGNALVGNDGSLASVVRFNGTKGVLGREQFDRMVGLLEQSLAVYLSTKGHQLQMVFRRDLDASATLDANAEQQRLSADRLHLALRDQVDEAVRK